MELQWRKETSTREERKLCTIFRFGFCLMIRTDILNSSEEDTIKVSEIHFYAPDGKFCKTEKQLINYMDKKAVENGRK